jgi:predicted permease
MYMANILNILTITAPIFILVAIGFFVVSLGWLGKDKVPGLAWFVVNIGLPPTIFKAMSSQSIEEIIHWDYLLVYGLGSLSSYFLLFGVARWRGKNLVESAFFGMGASMSNSLFIGFPVLFQLFGEAVLVPLALTLLVENILIFPLTLALADTGQKKNIFFAKAFIFSLLSLFKNPIFIGLLLGILCAIVQVQPPAIAYRVIDMLSSTVVVLALFTIGGMLVGATQKGMLENISIIAFGKLVIHPLAVFVFILLLPPMTPLFQSTAIIFASMSMFSVYAVLGAKYGLGGMCSATLLPTTLLGFITINFVLLFLDIQ